jgi:CubicO group peptidase (beta-lactamase class C family)
MNPIERVEGDLRVYGDTTHALPPQTLTARMQYYGVPGVSIAVVQKGEVAWARGYGQCLSDSDEQWVSTTTPFPAASISKPIVALAVLRLVEQGVLDLDTDVNDYLTTWHMPASPLTKDRKVTLRWLLCHGAGTTVYGFWGYRPKAPVPTLLQVLEGQPPANNVPVRVDRTPGQAWRYSGGGYCIIGQLLSDVLGMPFPALMDQLVLSPLGMERSVFCEAPPAAWSAQVARGHDATGAPIADGWRIHPELAAGGLWSTPSDLAKVILAMQQAYQQGSSILSQVIARRMLEVQMSNWALGWAIDGTEQMARFAHGGGKVGFRCSIVGYCHDRHGAVIMTNGERGDHLCVEILHSLARAYQWLEYYHYLDKAL